MKNSNFLYVAIMPLIMLFISCIPAGYASNNTPAKESELTVLTPSKGGTPDRLYDTAHAPKITVAAYNIAAARVSDLNAIATAIKSLNVDIIALSEVDNNTRRSGNVDQLEKLKKLTGMYGAFGKAIDFEGGEYGIAVLSRYPITRQATLLLPSPKVEQSVILATEIHKPVLTVPWFLLQIIWTGTKIQRSGCSRCSPSTISLSAIRHPLSRILSRQ